MNKTKKAKDKRHRFSAYFGLSSVLAPPWPDGPLGANGIAEVAVKTGKSVRRMAAGVAAVLGGSHVSVAPSSGPATATGSGPSG
jgi:hypothetical protein